jgi:predicted esterase
MRNRVLLLVVCLAAVTAGCYHLVPPPGAAPLRYRDSVFGEVAVTTDVPYGSAVNQQGQIQTLLLDVYEPDGDDVERRPAIVWVHGGSFYAGSKTSPEIVDEATTFAKKGFLTVSISYRLAPAPGCSAAAPTVSCVTAIVDAQHDAQAAVRFLRANAAAYRVDPDRIAIGGSSAGAITALNVGFNPESPGASGNPGYSSAVGAAVSLSGAKLGAVTDGGDAPSLLFHGTLDVVVPYQWAVRTVEQARAVGLASILTTWEGDGHTPYGAHRTEILDQMTNFLYHVLDLAGADS